MHELSVVEKFVETANAFAEEKGIDHVKMVTLVIGAYTGVLPKYVEMYFDSLKEGTRLAEAELIIEESPVECFCRNCGEVYQPEAPEDHHEDHDMKCPACGKEEYDVLQGRELTIKEIGY